MIRTNGLVLAAFLMASASPVAFAQPTTQEAETETTTEFYMQHRDIITQLSQPSAVGIDWEEEFATLSDDAEVNIVTLSELADADDSASPVLDQAMIDLDNDRDVLRTAIENNDTLMAAVEDEGYAVDDVVAAIMPSDAEGEVTLVVDAQTTFDFGTEDAEGETDL
jgi:hypothetical protein